MGIAQNRQNIQAQITQRQSSARLMAVSKLQSDARIEAALACGQRLFGENRLQEAEGRWAPRREAFPDLELHLIGSLQTNKAAQAVALFDVIQTLDREKLARVLAKEMERQEKRRPCYIQVNTGAEAQKGGIAVQDVPDFLRFCLDECGLDVRGLMCIPPAEAPAALHFCLLKNIADAHRLPEVSMGMSGDYQKALACGSTLIRVGSGFFGEREM